jgi:two-component system NtrC family sensor kinase
VLLGNLRWWNRLGARLTAAIVVVTLATMALLAALVLRTQRTHLEREVTESAALLSAAINRAIHLRMLADQREEAYLVMDNIGREEQIDRVRIFNKDGRITFSTERAETGRFVDKQAESCYACHAADRPIVRLNLPSRSRIYQHDGHRELGMVTPIYNETSCAEAACHAHPAEKRVLGVIDIGVSLARLDRDMATMQRATVGISALALLALAATVIVYTRYAVVRPVLRLVRATRRVASGDLRQRVPVESRSELGQLELSFNDMAESLARARAERLQLLASLEQQVEERTAELRAAQDRLVQSEKLSSLGRLAASVAHEINNPLAGILTYAKLLIRTLEDPAADDRARAAAVKQLRLVQRETERCTAIVRNMLDFARERPLTLTDIGVNAVIDEALMLVANQAKLQDIRLEKSLGDLPLVHADSGQLRQALINIIINACDAMVGGGRLTVVTRVDARGMVEVRVSDTGCGIPPEHLAKVLDPFFTTKEKGTGLGLSVVYGIVERHGGKVEIQSEVGKGTTVIIRLPSVPGSGRPPVTAAAGRLA